jgi:hypothetical protein
MVCAEWPALHPIAVRRERFSEVIKLLKRNIRRKPVKKDENAVIREKAGDDWF